jgi:acetyl esterase/lipase
VKLIQENQSLALPNALMLSSAVLNLSLELTYSRLQGTQDPVLPSGLLSVISNEYLPANRSDGIDKTNPLVSPIFANDDILIEFPPKLLFASSNDPLLDDSVVFNQRLHRLGVQSKLKAVQHLPHAYLGLGTAGFPEAQQIQRECCNWLSEQLIGTIESL